MSYKFNPFTKNLDYYEASVAAIPQTPWTSNIDGAGYNLTSVGQLRTVNNILDDGVGNVFLYNQANVMNFIKMTMEGGVTANMGIYGDQNIGGAYPMQFYTYDNSLGNGDNRVFGMQPQFNGGYNYNKAFVGVVSNGSLKTAINFGYDNQVYIGPTDWAQADALLQVDGTFHVNDWAKFDGQIGFFGHAVASQPSAYTPSNVTTDRSYNANATTIDELADVLGTLIADLQSVGLLG